MDKAGMYNPRQEAIASFTDINGTKLDTDSTKTLAKIGKIHPGQTVHGINSDRSVRLMALAVYLKKVEK